MEWHGGEHWVSADEAADILGVTADHIHARIQRGLIEAKSIGSEGAKPHIRVSDVAVMERDGLPHPDLEAFASGEKLRPITSTPGEWAVVTHPHDDAVYGLIALRHVRMGPHPSEDLWPGDIVSVANAAGAPIDRLVSSGFLAELPIHRGALGLIAELLAVAEAGATGGGFHVDQHRLDGRKLDRQDG